MPKIRNESAPFHDGDEFARQQRVGVSASEPLDCSALIANPNPYLTGLPPAAKSAAMPVWVRVRRKRASVAISFWIASASTACQIYLPENSGANGANQTVGQETSSDPSATQGAGAGEGTDGADSGANSTTSGDRGATFGDTSGSDSDVDGSSSSGPGGSSGAVDQDGDGHPADEDCDDNDPAVHPGAQEDPTDSVDADCDPTTDDGDGDGWSSAFGDCDDSDPTVSPDAPELLNGADDNCNGLIDEEAGGSVSSNLQTSQIAGLDYPYAASFGFPVGDGGPLTHQQDSPVDDWHVCTEFQMGSWCHPSTTHLGLDWNDDTGTDQGRDVRAIGAGVVVDTGWGGAGWGLYVIVRHDASSNTAFVLPDGSQVPTVVSLYAHLQNIIVAEDEAVEQGTVIAEIGPTAAGSTAPHLHHEVGADLSAVFPGYGYSRNPHGRVDPSTFVNMNQTLPTVYDAVQVSTGADATCVRRAGGEMRCWGWPDQGSLGLGVAPVEVIGDDEPPSVAGDVPVGGLVTDISAGRTHTCAVLSGGGARCWGMAWNGALGYGNQIDVGIQQTPADVGDIPVGGPVMQIAAGDNHTCALMAWGQVRCWGQGHYLGYGSVDFIGDDELPSTVGDVPVGGGMLSKVVTGSNHTCALGVSGDVWCWGDGGHGQLGYGNTLDIGFDDPAGSGGVVDIGGTVVDIGAGDRFTCALLNTGDVVCWGRADHGRLGYANGNTIGDDEVPAMAGSVQLGGFATAIAVGARHACALLDTGYVRCWGEGEFGRLGYGNEENVGDDEHPSAAGNVDLGGTAVGITAGEFRSCAVIDTGAVRCWGRGDAGGLGYGNVDHIGDNESPSSAGDVPFL